MNIKRTAKTALYFLIILLIAKQPVYGDEPNFWGTVNMPGYLTRFEAPCGGALVAVFNLLLSVVIVIGGLYALWQFMMAGYAFISSSGDPQKLADARAKIIWTIVGLLIMASALVLAGVIGLLFFGSWDAIINPTFTGVGDCE